MHIPVLILHILAATIWAGGHLVLASAVLPRALKERDVDAILSFESKYERIGMPALLIQIATGLGHCKEALLNNPLHEQHLVRILLHGLNAFDSCLGGCTCRSLIQFAADERRLCRGCPPRDGRHSA